MRLVRALIVTVYITSVTALVVLMTAYVVTRHLAGPVFTCAAIAVGVATLADILTRRPPSCPPRG